MGRSSGGGHSSGGFGGGHSSGGFSGGSRSHFSKVLLHIALIIIEVLEEVIMDHIIMVGIVAVQLLH